nr:peroxisomal membrane protein 13 [Tanacetum cinerariifolium]
MDLVWGTILLIGLEVMVLMVECGPIIVVGYMEKSCRIEEAMVVVFMEVVAVCTMEECVIVVMEAWVAWMQGFVTFFGRVAMLIDQSAQAFHMFMSALLQK